MARAAEEDGRGPNHGGEHDEEEPPAPLPPQESDSTRYLWRDADADDDARRATAAPSRAGGGGVDADADAASAAAPSPRPRVDFDPWRIEAERAREVRERQRRVPLSQRALVRALLWLHATAALLASSAGAAALLLATGRLLLRHDGGLACYSSADPASLAVCEVATGLGALSALFWAGFVLHFLAEAATAGGLGCGAVRPRYGQMAFEAVMGLAWGAVAAGATARRPEADARGTAFPRARGALAGLAVAAAPLFLLAAACDVALVFLLSVGYDSGALQRAGGIFGVMFTSARGGGGRRRGGAGGPGEEAAAAAAGGAAAAAAAGGAAAAAAGPPLVAAEKAPPGLRWVVWAPVGGAAARPRPQSAGSTFEMF